jgi:hypothetical protein
VLAGSGDSRGRILTTFHLTDDAYLAVSETVVVQGRHIHREEYAYFLVIDGEEIWGEERDPTHDPPVHRHTGEGHDREDSVAVSFKEATEWAWDEVTRRMSEDNQLQED